MYALTNVIGCPISSSHPMFEAWLIDRQYMNVRITPTVQQSTSDVVILWTHTSNKNLKGWSPNHFVPLVPETSKTTSAVGKSSGPVQEYRILSVTLRQRKDKSLVINSSKIIH